MINANNERIKRRYSVYLEEARGLAPTTIDHALADIADFEVFTGYLDFKKWRPQLAIQYKKALFGRQAVRPGELSSRATIVSKVNRLRRFFKWLAVQDGYRKHLNEADVEYFSMPARSIRLAKAPSIKTAPTLEQARKVILSMPSSNDIELRNRALVACALLTGARVAALASLKLKHVRSDKLGLEQNADEVHTKFAKTQTTFFFPVGNDIREIFLQYVGYLVSQLMWGSEDPLFPATEQSVGEDCAFHVSGLRRVHWKTADPIRQIFRDAFSNAELPYFTPHTFRNCLALLGEQICQSPEEFKAWSQNLGHDDVSTTYNSYGHVPLNRQAVLLEQLGSQEKRKLEQFQELLSDPEIQAYLNQTAMLRDLWGRPSV